MAMTRLTKQRYLVFVRKGNEGYQFYIEPYVHVMSPLLFSQSGVANQWHAYRSWHIVQISIARKINEIKNY